MRNMTNRFNTYCVVAQAVVEVVAEMLMLEIEPFQGKSILVALVATWAGWHKRRYLGHL